MKFEELKKKNLRTEDPYGYSRLHLWVNRQLGKADRCDNDSSHTTTRFHWANISGDYKKDLSDWRPLCPSCNVKEGVTDSTKELKRLQTIGNQSGVKPVLMVYPGGSWVKFPSSREASKVMGIINTSISNVLAGRTKTAGGYRWRRIAN